MRPPPRTVIITGGSSGIGLCTALLFARGNSRIGLIARGQAGLQSAAAQIALAGAQAATAGADVADADALHDAAMAIVAELGPPDLWVNCAGNGVYGRFMDVPPREFDRVTAVTYTGTVNGCRIALSLMAAQQRGTIVNVCSGVAYHGLPMMTSYSGAKAAVRAHAQALRAELRMARSPIRIVTVFPPAMNTPFFSHATSHMAWPARPAPPVYQPEVAAAGIALAARLGRAEMAISSTSVAFALATRLCPTLIAWCMTKLGFEGQLSRDPEAVALAEPTLFAPAEAPAAVHGPFGRRARRRSVLLAVQGLLF